MEISWSAHAMADVLGRSDRFVPSTQTRQDFDWARFGRVPDV
jgi:hypothetical protein